MKNMKMSIYRGSPHKPLDSNTSVDHEQASGWGNQAGLLGVMLRAIDCALSALVWRREKELFINLGFMCAGFVFLATCHPE